MSLNWRKGSEQGVLRKGSKKGLLRGHLEGRNMPLREYDLSWRAP